MIKGIELLLEDALGECVVGVETFGGRSGASVVSCAEVDSLAINFNGVVA